MNISSQLQNQVTSLAQILHQNKLLKEAAEQEITHDSCPVSGQSNLGAEQTRELHDGPYNVNADTREAENAPAKQVEEQPAGVVSLNQKPQAELAATGSTVENKAPDGSDSGTPAQVAKTASDYRVQLAQILHMSKTAAAQPAPKAEAPKAQPVITATEVLNKIAALTKESPAEAMQEAHEALNKLATTNPLFGIVKERIIMEKMAADISELAAAEGISPEEAAAELDAAQEANPEMAAELEGEAEDEAVGELADIEGAAEELGPMVDQMAANASEALGTEVSPDDILAAADEVTQQAEAMGVEPEALIQAALEQMQGEAEVDEEDLANAEEIMQAGSELGLSPEEVIQAAAGMLDNGEAAPAAAPEGEPEEASDKQASVQFTSPRAAYCAAVRAQR